MMTRHRIRRSILWTMLPGTIPLLNGCGERFLVFHPAGPVARTEVHLINLSIVLLLLVFIPVMIMLWMIVCRYRDTPNNQAPYEPEWSESPKLEIVWWGVPIVIVTILGIATVRTTFALTRPPESDKTPIAIQVTSLDWKWLFQYPNQKIATVNYCEIPTNRPVEFVLTAKSPMNSFWVPELGGQEYSMPGMAMRLWLQADHPGRYFGRGANFTGRGFAHMQFHVIAKSERDFNAWAAHVRMTAPPLTMADYQLLIRQNVVGALSYSSYPPGIFYDTVMQDGGMYSKHDMSVLHRTHKD